MADELSQLRTEVSYLREANGRHDANIQNLTLQLTTLTVAVTDLTAVLNRGRGALWVVVTASSAVGGGVAWLLNHFIGK